MSTSTPGQQMFPQFKAILQEASPAQKQRLAALWNNVIKSWKGQEDEVDRLRLELQVTLGTAIPRPDTTDSVTRARRETSRALEEEAAESVENSLTLRTIVTLPTMWLRDRLQERRDQASEQASHTQELGCWLGSGSPAHRDYGKINWRNTKHPNPGAAGGNKLIGVQPFAHQLAAVVNGDGAKMPLTAPGAGYEVRGDSRTWWKITCVKANIQRLGFPSLPQRRLLQPGPRSGRDDGAESAEERVPECGGNRIPGRQRLSPLHPPRLGEEEALPIATPQGSTGAISKMVRCKRGQGEKDRTVLIFCVWCFG